MDWLFELVKNNQLLGTAIGLSSAGIITFWVKDFPRQLMSFIKKELTTELIVTSQHISFHHVLKWVEKNYKTQNFRRLKMSNGRWGHNSETITSIGYGRHIIFYNKTPLIIELNKEQANNTEMDKESLIITKFGRKRTIFDDFINEVQIVNTDFNKTKIYKMQDCWEYVKEQPKRVLDSVFIEKEKRDRLIKSISKFKSSEEWYLENGIPYQLGILLHGAPGTGKTSMIKAIAGYLDYPIYYLSPSKLGKIESAMSTLPDKCVIVIEDIDSNSTTHDRENSFDSSETGNLIKSLEAISLSEVLNSLDGMFSAHGRILIATTNHVEKLDPALIRAGRIDLKVEIGYVNSEILQYFINNFYKDDMVDVTQLKINKAITVATLQNMVLENKSVEEVVKYCIES